MLKSKPKTAQQHTQHKIAPQCPRPNLSNPALLRLFKNSYSVPEPTQPRKPERRVVFIGKTRPEEYFPCEPEHTEGLNDLCQACEEGNYEWAKHLLKQTDPKVISWAGRNPKMKSPLHLAVQTGREEIIELLLGENANPNAPDADGLTPLTYAVEGVINDKDSLDITRRLVKHGACLTPDVKPVPILAAISAGHLPLAELLLENGAECADEDEEKALDTAVEADRADFVKLVVEHGLYRNSLHLDRALLTNIKMNGSREISKLLFDSHTGTEDQLYNQGGLTPLTVAVKRTLETNEDFSLVEMLLARYPPNAPDGCPLMFLAAAAGHIHLARLLISHGIDCDAKWGGRVPLDLAVTSSISNCTPLHVAARKSPDLTDCLIIANADGSAKANCEYSPIIHQDRDGTHENTITGVTPLHLAIGSATDMLIEQGHASVFDKDSRGRTPLFWAATLLVPGRGGENMAAVEHNLRRGSPVNLRDRDGYTPLAAVLSSIESCLESADRPVEEAGRGGRCRHMISTSYMFQDTIRHYIDVALKLIVAGANVEAAMNRAHFNKLTLQLYFTRVHGIPMGLYPYLRESLGPGYIELKKHLSSAWEIQKRAMLESRPRRVPRQPSSDSP